MTPPAATADRAQLAMQLWRTRLLDLSKRNRALNYKPSRVATVTIVDEQPAEVFRQLWLDEKPMRFRPTLPSAARAKGADDVDDRLAEDEPPPLATHAFASYDPALLDARHRDDVLQAFATPEALDLSLRRLDEQARASQDEQGVNTLYLALGMLEYTERAGNASVGSANEKHPDVFRAPLVLLPVQLTRRSARAGYTVAATEEEPLVNPALAEHLKRAFGVTLPELPADDDATSVALQRFYQEVAELAAERVRAGFAEWAVKTDIVLGLFAFQKLVMFKDMEANAGAFAMHRVVRQIVSREAPAGSYVMGLPDDIRAMALDRAFAPEATAQVVDADASQLRAIAAVSRGHDLVVEGPPGTGKSQTITNLVAQALNDGKTVLFVAEKLAALQVVHQRLVRAGLGEFCLELHGAKANKRLVMQELRTALDASLQRPPLESRTGRLPAVRAELSAYADAVHAPAGALGISPFTAVGRLDALLDAPRLPLAPAVADAVTAEALEEATQRLVDLAAAAGPVGDPARHAWRETGRTFYTPGALDDVREALDAAVRRLERVITCAGEAERAFALPAIRTPADVATASAVAAVLAASPGAPLAVLESEAWNAPPADATAFVERVRSLHEQRADIDRKFTISVFDQPHAADVAYMEQKASGIAALFAVFAGRYRDTKRRWLAYRVAGYAPALAQQASDLTLVDWYVAERDRLHAEAGRGQALFGALWQGERSDPVLLDRYIAWVVEVRAVALRHGLGAEALHLAARPTPDVHLVRDLEAAVADAVQASDALATLVAWPAGHLNAAPFAEALARVRAMRDALGEATPWAAFEQARQRASQTAAADLVARAMRPDGGGVAIVDLPRAFRRAVLERLLERTTAERVPLRDFSTITHEQRVAEFRRLDEEMLRENQATVVARLRGAAQRRLQTPAAHAGMAFLRREMVKQRNIAPLRRTLQNAEAAVRAIKPCFLMSPLTVAQYLAGQGTDGTPPFDLVIFDEASQLPTEDAIGAIARGAQLVVVGDPKQLPPTNFFAMASGTAVGVPLGDDGQPVVEDSESVLEECMGAGLPVTRLKWHYRSAHESLIAFSNVSFYDAELLTFPSVASTGAGLSFEYVADGVYEGKGLNLAEARRVADAVVRHAKESPDVSLGVGTFNMRQQLAVLDELELRRRADPSIEPFFSRTRAEPFFVKNLENVQGDERDVMFLSVTYGKAADGRLRYQFGPINGENGWRRLNVLATRARTRMRVFSSMRGDEINAAATTSRGALLLRDFLLYAEHGRLDAVVASAHAAHESPFEADVVAELVRHGVRVVPQVGVSGYRIDIGVLDDEVAGRFICGIECDGVAYHAAETARDRDRLRQQVLEARGWTILRVWSTDWFKDRAGQVARLLTGIERARAEGREHAHADAEAAEHARLAQLRESTEAAARLPDAPGAADAGPYVRPTGTPYAVAAVHGRRAGGDLLAAPTGQVIAQLVEIVEAEAPVHVEDVAHRMAQAWGVARVGSRIAARVEQAIGMAAADRRVVRRGAFLWTPALVADGAAVPVRSRATTRIPGERVAPEEVWAAARLVLAAAGGMTRDELLGEVRQVLGVGRVGVAPVLDAVVADQLGQGTLGEGSTGLALRE